MIKKLMRSLCGLLPTLLRDLAGLSGLAAVTFGAWQIFVPAGWIVGGTLAVAAVWLHSLADRAAPIAVDE